MIAPARPLVAIVGRPNVGKSTLFNRLVGQPTAVVSHIAGTTRDRVTAEVTWGDHTFLLVDTGGISLNPSSGLEEDVQRQVAIAMEEADVIIMVTDVSVGVTGDDKDAADLLRRANRPLVLAANKADNELRDAAASEFYELGLGDPVSISAYHNLGIHDLMTRVSAALPSHSEALDEDAELKIAIIGRTNVGKSLLLNAITGQQRAIVSAVPGTTRDALDTRITYKGKGLLLIDTAGIRRRGTIEPGIERYSVLRAVRAIDRTNVAVLLMDTTELATSQDSHIASYILEAYKGIILAANKWDLASEAGLNKETATRMIRDRFKFAPYAPICFLSALRRTGIDYLLDTAQAVYQEWAKEVPRYHLRRTVLDAVAEHPPASSGKYSVRIFSVAQDRTGPPGFTFYVNRPDLVHFSYQRYLENTLRTAYQFKGSPLRIRFKGRGAA